MGGTGKPRGLPVVCPSTKGARPAPPGYHRHHRPLPEATMASFNQVILLGNLTRDPQLSYIPTSNTPVVDFGLAVNRRFKGANGEERDEVTFVDCSAFGKQAEVINQYCQKGKQLFIQG